MMLQNGELGQEIFWWIHINGHDPKSSAYITLQQ